MEINRCKFKLTNSAKNRRFEEKNSRLEKDGRRLSGLFQADSTEQEELRVYAGRTVPSRHRY
jgi:hypothetical protein